MIWCIVEEVLFRDEYSDDLDWRWFDEIPSCIVDVRMAVAMTDIVMITIILKWSIFWYVCQYWPSDVLMTLTHMTMIWWYQLTLMNYWWRVFIIPRGQLIEIRWWWWVVTVAMMWYYLIMSRLWWWSLLQSWLW